MAARAASKPPPCQTVFPSARSKTIGKTTWDNRQESVRMVLCNRFGLDPSADFPISAGMVCGVLSQVIDGIWHNLSLAADGACSGADLAADPKEPVKYISTACGWASDLLGVAVKPLGALGAAGCNLAPSVGTAFGTALESAHEFGVAVDVVRHGRCIKYSPTHVGSPWLAERCDKGDPGFSNLPLTHRANPGSDGSGGGSGTSSGGGGSGEGTGAPPGGEAPGPGGEFRWAATVAPEPAGTSLPGRAFLSSVSCPAHNDCVAVGELPNSQSGEEALIETLGAGGWVASTAPAPSDAFLQGGPDREVALDSVSCASAGVCMAVGQYAFQDPAQIQGIGILPLAEELSGGVWTPRALPLPPDATGIGAELATIACYSDSCVAAGDYDGDQEGNGLLETFSDGSWIPEATPMPADHNPAHPPSLGSSACSGTENCIVVGNYIDNGGSTHGLIETLSNGSWEPTVAPLPADASGTFAQLNSASCGNSGFCIAVGWYLNSSDKLQRLLDTFSGGIWTATVLPLPANARSVPSNTIGSNLATAACSPSGGTCVAGGDYEDVHGNEPGLIETFEGGSWRVEESPLPPGSVSNGTVSSASCWASGSCVGVGFYGGTAEPFGALGAQGLIETLSGGGWTPTEATMPEIDPGTDTMLAHVACAPDGTCAALGTFEVRSNSETQNRALIETRQSIP